MRIVPHPDSLYIRDRRTREHYERMRATAYVIPGNTCRDLNYG